MVKTSYTTKIKIGLVSLVFLFLLLNPVSAQQLGEIICPKPGDTVTNGQLLVVFRLNPELQIKKSSIDIFIDRTSFKGLLKITDSKISILVTTPIRKGPKTIRITAKDSTKETIGEKWDFYVKNNGKQAIEKKPLKIKASVETRSRFSDISGDGASLRQEPPETHQLKFTGNIRKGNIEIPIKLYITNHEKPYLPPRDRFFIGFKSKKAGVFLGDVNPNYHSLMLNRTRIRGIQTFVRLGNTRFDLLYGTVNRPVEGLRLFYNSQEDPSYPPINLQNVYYDSLQLAITGYYNDNGTYRRNLFATKISISSPNTNNKIHFVVLKSSDDTTSIQYGGSAGQNLAFGIDLESMTNNKRLKFDAGIAAAFTTRDIKYGVASKETIKNLYGIDLPWDPYNFRKLLVFNSSSTMPADKYAPYLSFYLKPEYRFAGQTIRAEIRRIGSDYESFGNPYLINDRFFVSISDRMHFLKNRLFFQIRIHHFNNNLTKIDSLTRNTDLINASFNYLIKPNFPALNGGIQKYFRTGRHIDTKEKYPEYQISNYYGGVIYNLDKWGINTSLTLNYNQNQRDYLLNQNIVTSHSIFANLSQVYSFGLTLNLQYNFMLLTNDTSDFSKNDTYGIRIGYLAKNKKLRFSLGAMSIRSIETIWLPESARSLYSAILNYEIHTGFLISLEAGKSTYTELSSLKRNYDESWGQIGLKYRFVK